MSQVKPRLSDLSQELFGAPENLSDSSDDSSSDSDNESSSSSSSSSGSSSSSSSSSSSDEDDKPVPMEASRKRKFVPRSPDAKPAPKRISIGKPSDSQAKELPGKSVVSGYPKTKKSPDRSVGVSSGTSKVVVLTKTANNDAVSGYSKAKKPPSPSIGEPSGTAKGVVPTKTADMAAVPRYPKKHTSSGAGDASGTKRSYDTGKAIPFISTGAEVKKQSVSKDGNRVSETVKPVVHKSKYGMFVPAGSDFNERPVLKKSPIGESSGGGCFSETAKRMMQKMNYDTGKGLGKQGQGRVDIVDISTQKGRRGLGLQLKKLDEAAVSWNPSEEVINIPEKVQWFAGIDYDPETICRDDLETWVKRGKPKITIDDETKFCKDSILQGILQGKTVFDELESQEFSQARTRCNPFETIKNGIFMNRAALKMANLDAMYDRMFTKPVGEDGNSLLKDNGLLYFADVCAGPGGFSEYMLWRESFHAKGFGFTLKDKNDFKLNDFVAGSPEYFNAHYGAKGNGDIFDPENIQSFTDYVMAQTQSGVHVMMADGGFSVEGNENIQEIVSKQLYLCQILVALNIVRSGGHFVVKLFDLFTPFSVGLIYLVSKCFKQISICKPNTSRPANSERYLVCKWKKPGTGAIQRHLFEINEYICEQNALDPKKRTDILELVPYEMLRKDAEFFRFICESNNEIGGNQINALAKIAAFAKDSSLIESRQAELRSKCLKMWRVPDEMRQQPSKVRPEKYAMDLLGRWEEQKAFLADGGKHLSNANMAERFPTIHGWHFVPVACVEDSDKNIRAFFMSRGGNDVWYYDPKHRTWAQLKDTNLELPHKTLVYGEIVREYRGEGRSQSSLNVFHIIDGIVLGGKRIGEMALLKRLQLCEKFAEAVNKPFQGTSNATRSMPVRSKRSYDFFRLEEFFDRLEMHKLKDGARRKGYEVRNVAEPNRFYVPRGLLYLNEVRQDYLKLFSQERDTFYFKHTVTSKSDFFPEDKPERVESTVASFKSTFAKRVLWTWIDARQLYTFDEMMKEQTKNPEWMYRVDIEEFVLQKSCE